jgi:hypothetical protein
MLNLPRLFRRTPILGIYALPAALVLLLRISIAVLTRPEGVGHLCIEPDCYLKKSRLGLRGCAFNIILVLENLVANRALMKFVHKT